MVDKSRPPIVFVHLNYWERPRSERLRIPPGGRTTVLFNEDMPNIEQLVKEESKRYTPIKDNELSKVLSNSNLTYDSYRTSRRVSQKSRTSLETYDLIKDFQQDHVANTNISNIHSLRKTTLYYNQDKTSMKSILDHNQILEPKKYSKCSPGGPTTISIT